MRILAATTLLALWSFCAGAVAAAEDRLPVWRVSGDTNHVYLLGSVHLLREGDYPLPPALEAAYADAEALIMELDMDDLDPAEAQALIRRLGTIEDGGTLAGLLGADAWRDVSTRAAALDLPLEALANREPWLAAVTIEQHVLQRIGFQPQLGIETHFASRAVRDGKEITGLEDIGEQLGILDGLSAGAQRQLLLKTLEQAAEIDTVMDAIVSAWRRGDEEYLEANMLADMREQEEIYQAVVVTRNRDWARQIEALLDDEDDYLVIVGALHLVGEDGVPRALAARGYETVQLEAGL